MARARCIGAQIWAAPPSTNSSVPVTKVLSSEARKTAALAISSGVAEAAHRDAVHDALQHLLAGRPGLRQSVKAGVLIGPGLIAFTRIFRSFRSIVQVRANERTAALVAL